MDLYILPNIRTFKRWNLDVVAHGPSLHNEDTYYVIRRFESPAQREQMEDAYYASNDWCKGPHETILVLIESRFARILSLSWMRSLYGGCANKAWAKSILEINRAKVSIRERKVFSHGILHVSVIKYISLLKTQNSNSRM
jgi:hypothetical protein